MTTAEFIREYRERDIRQLALQANRFPDVDMPYALDQIQGWQIARRKLPKWAACDGVIFPPHLSMEQCSSEPTAQYKLNLAMEWASRVESSELRVENSAEGVNNSSEQPATLNSQLSTLNCHASCMTDLTGGFGVDFSFTSCAFAAATYVERNEQLCHIVEHNLPLLGLNNATVVCADAVEYLSTVEPQTMLFLDPARRDEHGAKTVMLADCTPDVVQLLPKLLEKSRFTMLKLSPMLDWHKAVDDLQGTVREVHIVSVGGECKELLLVLSTVVESELKVYCADLSTASAPSSLFVYTPGSSAIVANSKLKTQNSKFVHEPNASIMKAGCFDELAAAYGVSPVSRNSHLFLSDEPVEDFPGRSFVVERVTTMNKGELRKALVGIEKANIATRNFPLTVAELRKRLKIKDGGDVYIFATTTAEGEHLLLISRKYR
ncbi:THUMP-like domain-containing protein [Leyella stercorea]|uniref:THUMP-like domain-containing protein n=2 Tax=Leyella stercorea TaxID=363265 RepID=UPI00242A82C0|nr:SAM-dependent methyltransferase [Leyella stercorea]